MCLVRVHLSQTASLADAYCTPAAALRYQASNMLVNTMLELDWNPQLPTAAAAAAGPGPYAYAAMQLLPCKSVLLLSCAESYQLLQSTYSMQ
jgi:hypothetical protein